jgi:MFS family permease
VRAVTSRASTRVRPLESMSVPSFGRLWGAGALWNLTRWMTIFVGSYLVNQLTDSPLLVQLVGTSMFLPMFLGGLAAGAISDRFDRRRTVMRQLVSLVPLAILMAVLVRTGEIRFWMVYIFAIAVGIGQVVDMTNRRALVHDIVGERLVGNAMAIESLSMSSGNMLGSLTAGTIIGLLAEDGAYALTAVFYLSCFFLMLGVPTPPRRDGPAVENTSLAEIRTDLLAGVRSLPDNQPLVSLLGVTVIMNFMFFSFMPLVPVMAQRFDSGPFATGVLASALGLGMLIGAVAVVITNPTNRGWLYVAGPFCGMVALIGFALMNVYAIALLMLVLTGIGSAGFASVQSALVLSISPEEMRGRAMGLLSMSIGSLPFGMLSLGLLAEQVGPQTAVIYSTSAGIVVLALWIRRHPEITRVA